jgi:MFS family permease
MFFAGWVTTILFVPFAADKIGRRWIFFVSVLVTCGTLSTLYLSGNVNLTISMMFISGMATSGRTTVGYVYANEFLTPKW